MVEVRWERKKDARLSRRTERHKQRQECHIAPRSNRNIFKCDPLPGDVVLNFDLFCQSLTQARLSKDRAVSCCLRIRGDLG